MRVSDLGMAAALALGAGVARFPGLPPAAAGAGAAVSGVLTGPVSGLPLPGVKLQLGPAHLAVTDAAGRFRFPGVETGVYRLVVTGACVESPLRVEVRPGEDQEIAATALFDCAEDARMSDPEHLPAGAGHVPWHAMLVHGVRAEAPPACAVKSGAAVGDSGPEAYAIVASPDPEADLGFLAPGAAPAPTGADWIALVESCFAPWAQEFVVTAGGDLRVELIPGGGPARAESLVLRRRLCAGCVESFFAELGRLDLLALTGEYASAAPGGPPVTLAGVVGGRPFLIRTSHLRLAPVEAMRARLLDLCAFRSCVDSGGPIPIPISIQLDTPAEVHAGDRFTVRARVTLEGDADVPGAALALETAARLAAGTGGVSGLLAAGSPLGIEAQYEAPAPAGNIQGTITVRVLFAAEGAVPADPALHCVTRTIRVRPR